MQGEGLDALPIIGDFGLAISLNESEKFINKRVGSKGYTAPEILKGDPFDSKCDVFSLGCLLFALITAKLPFLSSSMEEYFMKT